jgi:hypothetical protein
VSFIKDTFFGGAAKKAAKAQVKATEMGIKELGRQFDLSRADLAPWREAGAAALQAGSAMLQPGYDYKTSPGYQFRFDEGQRAVESSGAAKGMLMSGGTLKDLIRFGDGVASADFGDSFNRQMAIAGGGQQAVNTTAALGADKSRGIADLYTQQGNARASGYMGQAQGIQQGIGQIAQIAAMFSDENLKEDVVELGYEIGGVPAISFTYRKDRGLDLPSGTFIGVRAQDVARLRPDALGPVVSGYMTVNYGALNAH